MRNQRFGRIVTYGFQGADHAPGWMYRSAFSAAKVGLVSLTKTIALEEAEYGITANMVCPGNIVGEMKEATIAYARQMKDDITPIGRSGTGEDIARVVEFLCDDCSDMITGAEKFAKELLQSYEKQAIDAGVKEVVTDIEYGSPKVKISKEVAPKYEVDLIVCGATGMSAVERFFIGSVSEHITRYAKCDVLVVRTPEQTEA
ncbi:unnamed protein product [marine sediment metagenome]|uniref:UspA domain-containing protein n=1 Tax=marine sediment metagenome TaxID=412755 RepID=X1UN99_9ZZZZ